MKTMNFLFALIVCIACVSCLNEEENFVASSENQLYDPTRKVFATHEDFKTYCEHLQKDGIAVADEAELSIVECYKQLTGLSELFNGKNEYQIGDTIYKLGVSGYTQYKIAVKSYLSAIELINREEEIIADLQSFNKLNDTTYEISDGVSLYYTGKPIIELQDISNDAPKTKTNLQYDTEVKVAFWTAHSTNAITCGYKVSAKKQSTSKAFSTYLTLECENVRIELGLPNGYYENIVLINNEVRKENVSTLSFTAYKRESLYANDMNINLIAGMIRGGAKAPNGRMVYATIER